MTGASHSDRIRDQFTRQATPFSNAAPINDPRGLQPILDAAEPGPEDRVLDLACGGGIVVCAFAPHVREASGIDMTPAMLDRARALAKERRLANVAWRQGDVAALPYSDGEFTIVATRFSMHHFPDTAAVFGEMVRVCMPGGRIVVADTPASADPEKAANFNRLERLRDPSHVRNLTLAELRRLFTDKGLPPPEERFWELRDEVKNLLARSFPKPGDKAKIIEMFRAAARDDSLGIPVREEGGRLLYAYPVAILSARRG